MEGRRPLAVALATASLVGLGACGGEEARTERALVAVAEAMLEVDDRDLAGRRPVLAPTWYPDSMPLPDRVREAVVEATGLEVRAPPPEDGSRAADTLTAVLTFYPVRDAGADTLEIEADWFFPYVDRAWADLWTFRVACGRSSCRVVDRVHASHMDYGG